MLPYLLLACKPRARPPPAVGRRGGAGLAYDARVTNPLAWPWPGRDGFDELPEQWLRSRPGVKWAGSLPDELPAWVADMDYPAPGPARLALADLASVADLGYGRPAAPLLEGPFLERVRSRFGWDAAPGLVQVFTDLVQAVQVLLHLLTAPGDGILMFTPAYPAFIMALSDMGRRLLAVPAVEGGPGGRWAFDLDRARALAPQAQVLLLVNPQNPTGRVLSMAELAAMAELAEQHDLLVISDEIHADLLLGTQIRHVPFASLSAEAAARTVTLYSASKAFNLGGMCCAVAHVGSAAARAALGAVPSHLFGHASVAAVATTLACWSPEGDQWLEGCLAQLRSNREQLAHWLAGAGGAAGVRGYPPEATYLQWLDFRSGALGDDPAAALADKVGVRLSGGPSFGPGSEGFARLNFATAPAVLAEMLDRIATA